MLRSEIGLAGRPTNSSGTRFEGTGCVSDPNTNLVTQVEYLLRHISWILKKRGREILKDFDITPPQFNALLVLVYQGNITMGELCRRLYLASSTVTDLIDRMEAGDLVARERDTGDRRVIRLRVLDRGHALVGEVMAARLRYLSAVMDKVDQRHKDSLVEALSCLHSVMTEERVGGTDT